MKDDSGTRYSINEIPSWRPVESGINKNNEAAQDSERKEKVEKGVCTRQSRKSKPPQGDPGTGKPWLSPK